MSNLIVKSWAPASSALATAGRDMARGVALTGRGAVGLAGVCTLLAAMALFGSAQVRDRVVSAALSATAVSDAGVPAEELVRAEMSPQRWGDWLLARPGGAVEPAQEHVTRYLSRRYKVAENAVRQIVGEAFASGRSQGVDPLLILAVTAVESSLNPFAQSPGGAQGLMQIMTRVHSDRLAPHGGDHAALDPIANLRVGSAILGDLIRRGGSVERGLQLYVGAGNLPDDGGYAARVLGEMARIRLAAGGEVREALSAGWRAENSGAGRQGAELRPVNAQPPAAEAAADRRSI